MALKVSIIEGCSQQLAQSIYEALGPVEREAPERYYLLNVGPDSMTMLTDRRRTLVSSDWLVLDDEKRPDGKVFYRYTRHHGAAEVPEADLPPIIAREVHAFLSLG